MNNYKIKSKYNSIISKIEENKIKNIRIIFLFFSHIYRTLYKEENILK